MMCTTQVPPHRSSPLADGLQSCLASSAPTRRTALREIDTLTRPSTSACSSTLQSSSSPSHRTSGASKRPYRPGTSAKDREEWHSRFLARCAERLRVERAAHVTKLRGHGLAAYHEREDPWTAEEEAILKRTVQNESRKLRWAVERQGDDYTFDDPDDALRLWEEKTQDIQEVPKEYDLFYSPLEVYTPLTLRESITSSICPFCSAPPECLQCQIDALICVACTWRLSSITMQAIEATFITHVQHSPGLRAHYPRLVIADDGEACDCICTACGVCVGSALWKAGKMTERAGLVMT